MRNVGKVVVLLAGVVVALLAAACGGGPSLDEPPEIRYGQDVCDNCNMIISEERFAAAYWTADGEARRFDDLGEMLAYMADNPEPIASTWVHDLNSAEWLRAEDAYYVLESGIHTPMGSGIVSCKSEDEARALAFGQENAKIMAYDQLLHQIASGDMGGGMSHATADD